LPPQVPECAVAADPKSRSCSRRYVTRIGA